MIACPSSLRFNWKAAVVRWMPTVPEEEVSVILSGKDSLEGQVVIISYDLLAKKQQDFDQYAQIDMVILDECHFVKG